MKQYFDLHIHSNRSFDGRDKIGTILSAARQQGLAGCAITDHDALTPVRSPYEDLICIPGSEIHVTEVGADLIGLGLTEPVSGAIGLHAVIDAIHDQGAIVIVPHPFSDLDWYPAIRETLYEIIDRVDAIEVTNPKRHIDNRRARRVADEFQRAKVGGSDAHRAVDVGRGVTLVSSRRINCADDLLAAIRDRATNGLLRYPAD